MRDAPEAAAGMGLLQGEMGGDMSTCLPPTLPDLTIVVVPAWKLSNNGSGGDIRLPLLPLLSFLGSLGYVCGGGGGAIELADLSEIVVSGAIVRVGAIVRELEREESWRDWKGDGEEKWTSRPDIGEGCLSCPNRAEAWACVGDGLSAMAR